MNSRERFFEFAYSVNGGEGRTAVRALTASEAEITARELLKQRGTAPAQLSLCRPIGARRGRLAPPSAAKST